MAFPIDEGESFSSSTHKWDYDVFLSFRGEDTRYSFTSYLYEALHNKGFKTFIDNDLQRGEQISAELIKAIKSSMILIIIFSQNYAFSTWCLEELTEILECKKNGQKVLPIFYKVDPSEVRKQEGNFGIALTMQEKKFENNIEKVLRWRAALEEAASLSGWHYEDGYRESHLIQEIIEVVSSTKLNCTELFVAKYPVGVDFLAKAVEDLLNIKSNDVHIVGIYGLGGIGKTTIAKAVYNIVADHFEGSSFLMNVRENSIRDWSTIKLQEKLLSEILGDKEIKVRSIFEGINVIKQRLSRKKFLLVLDDVDKLDQIDNFLGECDWLANGSRVIITTRDKHVLTTLENDPLIYEVVGLNQCESLRLFSNHAFNKNEPEVGYLELTNKFICYASGLPLALQIIGSGLRGRNIRQWESELEKYKNIPNEDIQKKLKVSFEGLGEIEKDIFLDIACFFIGLPKYYVVKILAACDLYPDSGIAKLSDKCLIRVECGKLWMHDLLQQMGKEIVRQESNMLGERSRLWCYEDALEVLTENTGVQFRNLKCINIMGCGSITRLPNLCAPNLEKLNLSYCRNLVECHESIGFLDKLQELDLRSCEKLQNFPSHLMWKSLKCLYTPSCSRLDVFSFLYPNFGGFNGLYYYCCKNFMDLADIIYKLPQVEGLFIYTSKSRPWCTEPFAFLDIEAFLDLSNVGNLIELDFLMKPDYFPVLEQLYLNEINIVIIPKRISKFTRLKTLKIKCCKYLQEIPRLPQSIRQVFIVNSHSLHPQSLNRLFSQFGEFWYQEYEILQPRQNPMNNFQRYELILPGSVIPKWFNHQSVGNFISFWIGRDFPTFVCCAVLEPKDQLCGVFLSVLLEINGTKVGVIGPFGSSRVSDMMSNHVWFFNVSLEFPGLNLYDQNYVEVVIETFNEVLIVRCGVHVQCICPLVGRFGEFEAKRQIIQWKLFQDQDHSTDTLPPTSIPAFPICPILNSVTRLTHFPSPPTSDLELSDSYSMESTYNDFESLSTGFHIDGCNQTLPPFPTSYLELSNSNSMEATNNDFDSLLNGFQVDGCDLSMSLYTSPMGRNYQPPQPQVTVLDDTSHISLPSSTELLNNMTYKSELLGMPDSGIGSTVSEGFHLGSSSMAHNFFNDDDSDFNLNSPSKKMRTS
ncbi:disease resistance protein RPV1 isoform X2 [Quercus suber]|uniref:disease resistance protein RPV1 isoform X2 n=1 Tax=Quercus suber TaxID=58331 RepID=UPI0032DF1E02